MEINLIQFQGIKMARNSIRNIKKRGFSPKDIAKKAGDHVRGGTRIRMLEYDLPKSPSFLWFGNQWKNLFEDWLKKGAKVELYAQRLSREQEEMVDMFKAQYRGNFHRILFGNVPDTSTFKKDDYISTHFTLFKTPRAVGRPAIQLWTEAEHNPGEQHMYGCGYFQPKGFGVTRKEEPWESIYRKYEGFLDYIIETLRPKKKSGRIVIRAGK